MRIKLNKYGIDFLKANLEKAVQFDYIQVFTLSSYLRSISEKLNNTPPDFDKNGNLIFNYKPGYKARLGFDVSIQFNENHLDIN